MLRLGLRSGGLISGGGLCGHLGGNINLTDRDGVGRDCLLDNRHDAPAFQTAERTGLHDLYLVAYLGFVFLVVNVKNGLAIDDLMVERMRRFISDSNLDGLIAGTAGDEADLGFALVALAGSG